MIQLTLEEFVAQFPPTMAVKLREAALRPDVAALARVMVHGRFTAEAFTEVPTEWPFVTHSIYCKDVLTPEDDDVKSKTMQAIDLVLNEGLSQYAAAQQMGISQAAVSRAFSRREDKVICPCCQQVVREGYTIDKTVLKPKK